MFQKYCMLVAGDSSEETIKKETKKLKHAVFMYNFYKGIQQTIFMHFH